MKFHFPLDPVPKGRPRFGAHGNVFTPDKTRIFERQVKLLAKAQWKIPPIHGAVRMDVVFVIRRPVTKKSQRPWPTVRPDLDNLVKAIKDALNGVCWMDDDQVCILNAIKQYGDKGEIVVSVESLDEQE